MSEQKKWKPNEAQRAILESLIEIQNQEKNVAEFVRKYLTFSYGRWTKICKVLDDSEPKSYFDEITDRDAAFAELEIELREAKLKRKRISNSSASTFMISQLLAVQRAVREASDKKTAERLVKYLSPTGGGKTIICEYLEKEMNARLVQARQPWKNSYITFLEDVSRAVGYRLNKETRASKIESGLIQFLNDKTILLAFDEAEYFGAQAIDGVKLLLNETRMVPLLCAIADAHDSWNRYFSFQSDQLARRTHAIIELVAVQPDDVGLFFSETQFEDRDFALNSIADAATRFGAYSLVNRIAQKMKRDSISNDDVKKMIGLASAQMKRVPRSLKPEARL